MPAASPTAGRRRRDELPAPLTGRAVRVDGVAWYPVTDPGLPDLWIKTRDGEEMLTWPGPPGLMAVPRSLAPPPGPAEDARPCPPPKCELQFTGQFRSGQAAFVHALVDACEARGGAVGNAPTGFGKTVCGIAAAVALRTPACVVVPKGDLGWADEVRRLTDLPEDRIAEWQGKALPPESAQFVVASLQSVYRAGVYPEEVYRRFGLVIFDEVHRLGADQFRAAIPKFPARYRIGLSATPDRRDGLMAMVRAHIGTTMAEGTVERVNPKLYVIGTDWAEPVDRFGAVIEFDPTRTNHAKRSLMADPIRNAMVAGAIARAHRGRRRVVAFFDQIRHIEQVRAALVSLGVPSDYIVSYTGGTSAADRERAASAPEGIVVLGTYKMLAEGTDIPPLDVAVLAYPLYDVRQAVGRIRRVHPGKPAPIIIDVVDYGSPTLVRIANARHASLAKTGVQICGEFR